MFETAHNLHSYQCTANFEQCQMYIAKIRKLKIFYVQVRYAFIYIY